MQVNVISKLVEVKWQDQNQNLGLSDYKSCMVYTTTELLPKHQKDAQCILYFTLAMVMIFVHYSTVPLVLLCLPHTVLMIARHEAGIKSDVCGHGNKQTNNNNKTP